MVLYGTMKFCSKLEGVPLHITDLSSVIAAGPPVGAGVTGLSRDDLLQAQIEQLKAELGSINYELRSTRAANEMLKGDLEQLPFDSPPSQPDDEPLSPPQIGADLEDFRCTELEDAGVGAQMTLETIQTQAPAEAGFTQGVLSCASNPCAPPSCSRPERSSACEDQI